MIRLFLINYALNAVFRCYRLFLRVRFPVSQRTAQLNEARSIASTAMAVTKATQMILAIFTRLIVFSVPYLKVFSGAALSSRQKLTERSVFTLMHRPFIAFTHRLSLQRNGTVNQFFFSFFIFIVFSFREVRKRHKT